MFALYYNNEFNKNRNDMRKMWNSISDLLNKSKNKKTGIKNIIVQGNSITDPQEIANHFNDFFINIGPSLNKKMAKSDNQKEYIKYLNHAILTSFNFDLTDDESLKKTLNLIRTKSSCGYDGISTRLLKFLAPALTSSLRTIINQSLVTGIYPDKLKIAKVIPLYNKRPISLYRYTRAWFKKKAKLIVFIFLLTMSAADL